MNGSSLARVLGLRWSSSPEVLVAVAASWCAATTSLRRYNRATDGTAVVENTYLLSVITVGP